jgi:hypothetical protein
MKRKLLKYVAIALLLAGTAVACKEKETNEQPVEISFVEYSLPDTNCQWKNLAHNNNLIVINRIAELKNYCDCTEGSYPDIDFEKNTLLIAGGGTTNGIHKMTTELSLKNNIYYLNIDIALDFTTVAQGWSIVVITEKINSNNNIRLNINQDYNWNYENI